MDILATQVYDDTDFTPTQQISEPTQQSKAEVQVGVLNVGSDTYPIKKGVTKIGRHPECNIILNDQTVSKKHAEIEANGPEASAWICDLNSSNKTKLNNSVLRPGRCYELKDGSVIEFGMVHAVYKVHPSADDSLVPETPILHRPKNQQLFIPGTPDLSSDLNNSSTLGNNMSVIPATQDNNQEPTFRRPSAPSRNSISSDKKSLVHDSSADSSINNSRNTVGDKENVGEQKVSIHDAETQKPCESLNESEVDIHDVETQKLCLTDFRTVAKVNLGQPSDIHDVETQHEETRVDTSGIDDTNVQSNIDIHDMKTPKRIDTQNMTACITNSATLDENLEATRTKSIHMEGSDSCSTEVQQMKAVEASLLSENTDQDETTKNADYTADAELAENMEKTSEEYLQLSPSSNFDDCSELDVSRPLLASQNLLENFIDDDEPPNQTESELPTFVNSPTNLNDTDDMDKGSSGEENIFDAATQLNDANNDESTTRGINNTFKPSLEADDSDATTEEGTFQSYVRSKDNQKISKDQCSDSDESITDEEGHLEELAIQEKRNASSSFETRQNTVNQNKSDHSSSKGSDDMFDMLTQQIQPRTKNLLMRKDDDNSNAPTQVVLQTDKSENNVKTNKSVTTTEIDTTSTQVPTPAASSVKELPIVSIIQQKDTAVEDDITEMEDEVATQVISISDKIVNDSVKSSSPADELDRNPIEDNSVEDIDYEMAPTQLLSDIEKNKSTNQHKTDVSEKVNASNKISLNDTLENNLNAMFHDVNDERIEDQQQISTQDLKNVLQSSQSANEPEGKNPEFNQDSRSSPRNEVKRSTRGRKSKTTAAGTSANSGSGRKTHVSNVQDANNDSDFQNTENYFSVLTSRRKRNILTDSQEFVDLTECVSNNKTEKERTAETRTTADCTNDKDSVFDTPSRPEPKSSSTPISTKKDKYKQLTVFKSVPEEVLISKNTNECSAKINDSEPSTSNDTKQRQHSFALLEDDDEDIMAGLPEVRISGTLSNPPSPSLSKSRNNKKKSNNVQSKKNGGNATSKKGATTRKSSRKTLFGRLNTENDAPYHSVTKSDSANHLESLSNTFPVNIGVDTISTRIEDKANKKSTRSVRSKIISRSHKSEENDSLPDKKSAPINHLQKQEKKQSPFVQGNRGTRNTSKENVDRSSVFQVGKEAPVKTVTIEPMKQNVVSASRIGKRSLSTTDAIESNNVKKRREDIDDNIDNTTKGRSRNARKVTANRRYSANIMNFITKKKSPIHMNGSEESTLPFDEASLLNKQAVINIVRLSSHDLAESTTSSTPAESVAKNVTNIKKQGRATKTENKPASNVETRQHASRKTNNKCEMIEENVTSQVGEESQEVEMIMNGSFLEQNTDLATDARKNFKETTVGVKTRTNRKRANTSDRTVKDVSESNTSSDLCESNNIHFEVPASKPKRAKTSKSTSNVISTNVSERPVVRTRRNNKQLSKSNTSQQQLTSDSSVEERLESSTNINVLDNTVNRTNNSRRRAPRTKVEKFEVDKKQDKRSRESSVSSDINSTDTSSIISTPTRTRRSLSSISSPLSTRHKILFTGISSNDYNKLLIKLGASQVENPTQCTVLVTDKVRRTVKFLCALAQSVPIVSVNWLIDSDKAGHFMDLKNYILEDSVAEDKFGFKLRDSLDKAKQHKLLEGYSIVLTPNVAPPPLPELKSIIVACGGKALVRPPMSWSKKVVIISREEDSTNAKKFLAKAPKTVTVQSTEFILTGILKQELDFVKYRLL